MFFSYRFAGTCLPIKWKTKWNISEEQISLPTKKVIRLDLVERQKHIILNSTILGWSCISCYYVSMRRFESLIIGHFYRKITFSITENLSIFPYRDYIQTWVQSRIPNTPQNLDILYKFSITSLCSLWVINWGDNQAINLHAVLLWISLTSPITSWKPPIA